MNGQARVLVQNKKKMNKMNENKKKINKMNKKTRRDMRDKAHGTLKRDMKMMMCADARQNDVH